MYKITPTPRIEVRGSYAPRDFFYRATKLGDSDQEIAALDDQSE